MTSQQYLLNQAEHCRRTAATSSDPFVAEELLLMAREFEEKARPVSPRQRKAGTGFPNAVQAKQHHP